MNDGTTICGMGDAAGYATIGILNKFRDEFEYCIEHKRSRFDGNLECPQIFIDGQPIQAERGQTVLQAALAHGFDIPYFCWHPALSIAGNCRICVVQVEGRSWVEIACNMPVTEGLRVLTDSDAVREYRKSIMQLTLLNHPVDCGICDKAGECTLQDYHYKYNGAPSMSHRREGALDQVPPAVGAHRARQRALHPVLALRALHARDLEVECARHRAARRCTRSSAPPRTGSFDDDPYSDNVDRPLPGRRAAVALVPVQVARLVSAADAVGLPGLRARLHGQHLAPQAGVEAQRARPATERRASSA